MVFGSICYSSLAHLYGRIYSCVCIHVFLLHLLSYWDKIEEWHWNMKLFVSAMTLLSNEIIFWATKKSTLIFWGNTIHPLTGIMIITKTLSFYTLYLTESIFRRLPGQNYYPVEKRLLPKYVSTSWNQGILNDYFYYF